MLLIFEVLPLLKNRIWDVLYRSGDIGTSVVSERLSLDFQLL